MEQQRRRRLIQRGLVWFALPLVLFAPVNAQIIEINAEGEAVYYDGPTVTNDVGPALVGEQPSAVTISSAPVSQIDHIERAERDFTLPKGLIDAVIYQESRGRMNAVSVKGALGLMQLMPGTAAELGVNPYIADQNIRGGAMYLRQQIDRFGSIPLGLAAYNAGPGAVLRHRGIPPFRETQNYVASIMGRWKPPAAVKTAAIIPLALPVEAETPFDTFLIEVTNP